MKESERRLIFRRTVEPRDPSLGEPEEVKIEAIEIFGIPDVMVSGLYEGQWIANRGERSVVQMLLADLEAAKAEVERLRKREAALESVVVERKRLHDAMRKYRDDARADAARLRDALEPLPPLLEALYRDAEACNGVRSATQDEVLELAENARRALAASESPAPASTPTECAGDSLAPTHSELGEARAEIARLHERTNELQTVLENLIHAAESECGPKHAPRMEPEGDVLRLEAEIARCVLWPSLQPDTAPESPAIGEAGESKVSE